MVIQSWLNARYSGMGRLESFKVTGLFDLYFMLMIENLRVFTIHGYPSRELDPRVAETKRMQNYKHN